MMKFKMSLCGKDGKKPKKKLDGRSDEDSDDYNSECKKPRGLGHNRQSICVNLTYGKNLI